MTMEPFETIPSYGGIIIKVALGNNVTARFLLDTGFTAVCITEKTLKNLPKNDFENLSQKYIEKESKKSLLGKSGQIVKINYVTINNIKVRDFPMYVIDNSLFEKNKNFSGIDGVLGMNYLSHFCLYLDYPKKQFFLNAGGNLSAESLRQIGFGGNAASPLPLEQSPKNEFQYVVPLSINNITVPLQIDTGSQYTIINDKAIPTGGIVTEAKKDVLTAYGRKTLREISHKEVVLGSFRRQRFSVWSTPEPADKAEGYYGLLGLDILSSLRMVLDFPAKKMYLMETQP
jgi:predicted aspartyl protease